MSPSKNSHIVNIEVRYRDTDSMGHISSPVYYEYLQHSYLNYMFKILKVPYTEKLPQIMVKTSCEYIKPALFGDHLEVHSKITRIGNKSFEMEHIMYMNNPKKTLIAKGFSTHVMFDYQKNQTVTVSDEFRNTIESYQKDIA